MQEKGSFAISVSAVTPFLIFIRLFLLHQSQNCIQEVFTSGCKTFSWEVQQGHLNLSDLNQVENLTLTFTLQYSMNIIFGTPFIILFYCRQGYFYWIFNQWEFPGLFHRGGCWTQGGATNQLFAGWYKKQSKQLKVKKKLSDRLSALMSRRWKQWSQISGKVSQVRLKSMTQEKIHYQRLNEILCFPMSSSGTF